MVVVGEHGYKDSALWDRISAAGGVITRDPIGAANDAGRPLGHTTHNVFVKCKKTKKMYLITTAQGTKADLKKVAVAVGAKELRLCSDREDYLSSIRGCITALSLFYDEEEMHIEWVVEDELLTHQSWCICAGCQDPLDHAQHNVVTLSLQDLEQSIIPKHFGAMWTLKGIHGASPSAIQRNANNLKPVTNCSQTIKKEPPPKEVSSVVKPTVKSQEKFADDHLFVIKPASSTIFSTAFQQYNM